MDCYEELVNLIKNEQNLFQEISQIRNLKKFGNFDPITLSQEYRLIGAEELEGILDSAWVSKCQAHIEKENDFRGIRVINKNSVVIEIDEFNRHTLNETTSRDKTIEFHRLIFSNKPLDKSKFYFGTEHQIWRDTIKEDLIYEVTQLKTLH